MYTGSCLCGGVRYEIHAELADIQVCHCLQCRKAQGGPFATNIPVPAEQFSFVSGSNLLKEYESTPGKFRVFCGTCGSPLISKRTAAPEVVRVRAGTITEPLPVHLASHAFVASKANWWRIDDDCPQFEQERP